ncbi:MAG: hypothetical protein AUI47_01965 [Acidobacteria bacterium 13_1_40CM_2_68_5]|nr:MAG: hypothetical protein AUI47_01965 [Acidobacteria bacterium 13_1_40CM_2_68_5]
MGLSMSLHVAVLCAASLTWIVVIEPVAAPPTVVRFVTLPPPAPRFVVSRTTAPETTPPEEPAAPASRPVDERPSPTPHPSVADAVPPPPLPETAAAPAAVVAAPHDTFEPPVPAPGAAMRAGSRDLALMPVDTFASVATGRAGDGGGLDPPAPMATRPGVGRPTAGAPSGSPTLPEGSVLPMGTSSMDRARGGRPIASAPPGDPGSGVGAGGSDGQAATLLGRRYNVDLIDASSLGRSTHDGWRYNLLVPMLSEVYHRIEGAGRPAPSGDDIGADILSVRVDPDAVIIAYLDGTRHVIAPTKDGLVALYVTRGAAGRGKVEEAQRALGALRRLARDGVSS